MTRTRKASGRAGEQGNDQPKDEERSSSSGESKAETSKEGGQEDGDGTPVLRKVLLWTAMLASAAAVTYIFSDSDTSDTAEIKRSSTGVGALPKEEVEKVLKSAQRTVRVQKLPEGDLESPPVVRYDINAVPSNSPVEDYHTEHKFGGKIIFGIYDGHGGTECANLLSQYLAHYVARSISALPKYTGGSRERSKDVASALKSAFKRLDSDITNGGFDVLDPSAAMEQRIKSSLRPAVAGSCAIVAYFEGNDLYIACTGDSRAVLGRRRGDGSFEAIPLSADQTIKNPAEYARILEEHPANERETVFVRGRVLGSLMPTRAFGDSRYKWPSSVQEVLLPHLGRRSTPRNYHTPPYITAEPEVTHYKVEPGPDRFLILASDGLYDRLTSDECVELVASYMEQRHMLPTGAGNSRKQGIVRDENAATHLIRNALGKGDDDVVAKLLAIPAPQSRKYRDDITVNVMFFRDRAITGQSPIDAGAGQIGGAEKGGLQNIELQRAGPKVHRLDAWVNYFSSPKPRL
ncbi:hypothetical protein HK104_007209 [Borealophlyctis nickersoniae]|nr:hypothetical protein HK104_007209 [Borealophlyctis nickersoniae]